MELVSGSHIPDGLLAAITLLSEKPRQGVPSWNPAPIQGISEANCTALLGLRFGCSGIVSGTVVAPNNTWLHNKVCGALSKLTSASMNSGLTIGAGGGASFGAGIGVGLNFSGSVQLIATPNGGVGIALTSGFGPWIFGAGYLAGGQVSVSNAQNLNDVRGSGMDLGVSAGGGYGAGLDYTQNPSGSVKGGSLTVGVAGGGKISTGATYTHTWIPSFLSTNCGG